MSAELDPLVRAAARGDREAMHRFVVAHQQRVRNLVRYLVRGDGSSDDIAQECLLVALDKLSGFRGEGSLVSWLDGVVLRVTLRQIKRRRLRDAREVEALEELPSCLADPERYLERRRVVHALDTVPEAQRSALVQRHVLGMSVEEISRGEGVPRETVRSRLRHGMDTLRVRLGLGGRDDD